MNIYVKESGSPPPVESHYYLLASNGSFLCKENQVLKTVLRVRNIPTMTSQQEVFEVKYPKISMEDSSRIIAFLCQMYKKFGGEAIVLMYYSKAKGYLFHVPEQLVGAKQLEYCPSDRFDGYLLVGSIHSHGDGMACHSSGHAFSDYDDEVNFDGMHITFGNINSSVISLSCSVMVDGRRFFLNPEDYISGIKEVLIPQTDVAVGSFAGNEYMFTDTYWAPMSGFRNWGRMTPIVQPKKDLLDKEISVTKPAWWSVFYKWYSLGFFAEEKVLDKKVDTKIKVKEPVIRYMRNPVSLTTPFFFSLEFPNFDLSGVQLPEAWYKNVKKLPVVKRVKNYLSPEGERPHEKPRSNCS